MQKRIIFLLLFMFATSAYADKMLELRKEANEGNAEAQFELGLMYENGKGVWKDKKKAVEWYTKSAEQGHAYAQFELGLMYENGRVVKRDFEKAVEWYTKSAEQGHQIAKIVLSEL